MVEFRETSDLEHLRFKSSLMLVSECLVQPSALGMRGGTLDCDTTLVCVRVLAKPKRKVATWGAYNSYNRLVSP